MWFAIYETATGRLESVGELVANPLPAQFTSLSLAVSPGPTQMWDPGTRTFIARPPKVIRNAIVDTINDVRLVGLSLSERAALQSVLQERFPQNPPLTVVVP